MEATQLVRPGYQTVAIAIAELVEKLHQLLPGAVIKPSEPYEDEDVCLVVYGLWDGEELQRIRNQVYALEFELYDKYELTVRPILRRFSRNGVKPCIQR